MQAADGEFGVGVLRVDQLAIGVYPASAVLHDFGAVLRIDGMPFAVHIHGVEERRHKELRKSVERRFQVVGIDIEKVIGVLECGIRVVAPAVCTDKALVLTGLGELLRAKKQHVLQKVRQTLTFDRVAAAADVHVQGGRGFVGARVGDDQCL